MKPRAKKKRLKKTFPHSDMWNDANEECDYDKFEEFIKGMKIT